MKQLLIFSALVLLAYLLSPLLQAESERHVHINGEHLTVSQMTQLDQLVGNQVADGYYWINLQTGQWGYEGNPDTQGVIQSISRYAESQPESSSSPRNSTAYNDVSSTGTVTSGKLNGQDCTFVSVGVTTMKSCN